MRRFALAAATCLRCILAAPAVFAQATKAAPPSAKSKQPSPPRPRPRHRRRRPSTYKPVKGIAAIQVIPSASKKVGDDDRDHGSRSRTCRRRPIALAQGRRVLVRRQGQVMHRRHAALAQAVQARRGHRDHDDVAVQAGHDAEPVPVLARQRQDRCEAGEEVRRERSPVVASLVKGAAPAARD